MDTQTLIFLIALAIGLAFVPLAIDHYHNVKIVLDMHCDMLARAEAENVVLAIIHDNGDVEVLAYGDALIWNCDRSSSDAWVTIISE